MKLPRTLGACADRLLAIREEVAKLKAVLDRAPEAKKLAKLAEEAAALDTHLIDNLPKSDAEGIVGKRAKAVVKVSRIPTVKDWDLVYKHVLKTKDFSLLHRAVSIPAIRERWEAKQTVPGVDVFNKVSVSVTAR